MTLKHSFLAAPRWALMKALAPLERRLLGRTADGAGAMKPVFIVGPPRSGTTLLYEALVTRFHFAYFSNASHRLHRTPVSATKLFRRTIRDWTGSFESTYGKIAGWGAPCEAGWIWDRWRDALEPTEGDRLRIDPGREMRSTLDALSAMLGAPFLGKNVELSECLPVLDRLFPGCVFLEIRRDPGDCIRSIHRLRERRLGTGHLKQWLSVKPRGWDTFRDAEPIEQIAAQVFGVHRDVAEDARRIGTGRVHTVHYESLCANPHLEMERIEDFLLQSGIDVRRRGPLPTTFSQPVTKPLDSRREDQIRDAIRHWTNPGTATDAAPVRCAA